MKAIATKGILGLLGISGLGTGIYYGYEALTSKGEVSGSKDTPKDPKTATIQNIKSALIKAKYTPFELSAEEWTNKFKEFRDHETNGAKFALALKSKYTTLTITKGQDLADGGAKLQTWCQAVLNEKENTEHEHQNLDNAKLFCATAPAS